MRLYSQKIAFVLVFVALAITSTAQSPWAQGKGKGYSQILFNTIPTYAGVFNGSEGVRQTERFISETILASFTEIGVTDNLTFAATVPLIFVSTGDASSPDILPSLPEDRLSSLGNISFSTKYSFGGEAWKFALNPRVDLPTSTRNDVSGLSTGVDAWTIQPAASAGKSGADWFYYGFFGYGLRSNNHNDFLNYGIEAGKKLNDKITFIINVSRLENIDNGDPSVDSPANIETGLFTSFQEYTGYILKFFADDIYKDFGVFGSIGGGFNANSVASSPALSLGIFRKW
jgi:hypothetical protein